MGYEKLHNVLDEKRAIDAMKHAEKHIACILFLEGQPIVSTLDPINIGQVVDAMHKNDWDAENGAIKAYNEAVKLTVEVGDNGTREMLGSILKDEEEHIDCIEAQIDQIQQMELPNSLAEQLG